MLWRSAVAIGINWDGRRCVLAVELAGRESTTSWRELLLNLKQRGGRDLAIRGFAGGDEAPQLVRAARTGESATEADDRDRVGERMVALGLPSVMRRTG